MIHNYKSIEQLLQSQSKFTINLGLERVKSVLDLINNPQDKIKIIHVAGTNGKGSVCSILANILKHSGLKTGLYTSPHLIKYTERIKINNKNITEENFAKYISFICELADKHNIDLTEFEILTISAFKYFYDEKVDIAIIETGLGGRLDATNVCKNPVLSIITSISLDHTDRLGNTYEQIAYEKGGIIKKNSIVIISKNNNGYKTIEKIAYEKNAKLISVEKNIETVYEDKNYAIINKEKYEFPLIGLYQNENLSLVIKALEILGHDYNIKDGLKTAKWNARLEYKQDKNILIDGAHNPDSARELRKSLDLYFKNQKRTYIYSTIDTKDYREIAKILFTEEDTIYFLEFNHKNAVKYEDYIKVVNNKNIKKITKEEIPSIIENDGLKIITGSLYMIGEVYNLI